MANEKRDLSIVFKIYLSRKILSPRLSVNFMGLARRIHEMLTNPSNILYEFGQSIFPKDLSLNVGDKNLKELKPHISSDAAALSIVQVDAIIKEAIEKGLSSGV